MREWADDSADEFNQNLMCLRDFNIEKSTGPGYEAFASRGLFTPPELRDVARTLPSPGGPKFYDQIAWFTDDGRAKLTLAYSGRASAFAFDRYVMRG